MAARAQTVPPVLVIPPPSVEHESMERTLREILKKNGEEKSAVCSIPLKQVLVANNAIPMRVFRPRKPVEPMPLVPLPAPPCKEEKR
jgi:hypothetical protein